MGGRGTVARRRTPTPTPPPAMGGGAGGVVPQAQQSTQQSPQPPQAPQPLSNVQASKWVPAGIYDYQFGTLDQLSDQQMYQVLKDAENVNNMPTHLNDSWDATQRLVYVLGYNQPPEVLPTAQFNQYMKDNNMGKGDILSRSVNSGTFRTKAGMTGNLTDQQVVQSFTSDPYNYISGKRGGMVYGGGTYFDHVSGRNTGYGGRTFRAVINPKTAKIATTGQIDRAYQKWAQTHPKSDAQVQRLINKSAKSGTKHSIKALITGYNVVSASSSNDGYMAVILRNAVVADGG